MERSHTGVTIEGFNFSELRADLYPIIHSKNLSIDDLIWLWDFFKEHETVIDKIIKEEKWGKVMERIKQNKGVKNE